MKRQVYLLGAALTLMTSASALSQTAPPVNPSVESKPTAPAFSLTSTKGKALELAALRGKVVVLNFWFVGCQPCVAEFTKLNGLVDKFKNKGVVFIAPTWDKPATLRRFLKKHPFKYHVVPDAGSLIIGPYSDGSGQVVFPTHLVIDQEGKIDTRLLGSARFGDLRKAITRLVNNPSEKGK